MDFVTLRGSSTKSQYDEGDGKTFLMRITVSTVPDTGHPLTVLVFCRSNVGPLGSNPLDLY